MSWRFSALGKLFYLRGEVDESKQKIRESIYSARGISPFQKTHPLVVIVSAICTQKPRISTLVLGAIYAFFQKIGSDIFDPLPLGRYYDDVAAHAREALGNQAFESTFAEGQKISLDEALELLLETVDEI